jgi:hypothetical protein
MEGPAVLNPMEGWGPGQVLRQPYPRRSAEMNLALRRLLLLFMTPHLTRLQHRQHHPSEIVRRGHQRDLLPIPRVATLDPLEVRTDARRPPYLYRVHCAPVLRNRQRRTSQ